MTFETKLIQAPRLASEDVYTLWGYVLGLYGIVGGVKRKGDFSLFTIRWGVE